VLGIVGIWPLTGVGSIAALILGIIGAGQIKRSGGNEKGTGLAVAGIVLGAIGLVLVILFIALIVALRSSNNAGVLGG
jgi:uncharacterized membrane protein